MDRYPLKIIPPLEEIIVLPNLADKFSLWREKFIAEAEKKGYCPKMGKGGRSIELRKNYRGRTEILFSQDQNNILASFSYKFPFYCKFISIASFFSFFAFFLIGAVLTALAETLHFNYGDWALVVCLSSLCILGGFGFAFLFLIARYDSKRRILLPDQRIELISIAQMVRIAQDSSVISETSYLNTLGALPDLYNNIEIIYNAPNIEIWKEKFLDLVKENSYLSNDQSFFNYLQLTKANRKFEVEFKWNYDVLLILIGFRPHNYYFIITLGLLSSFLVLFVLIAVLSLSHLFLIIPIILFGLYAAFRIWYAVSIEKYSNKRKMAAPEYIDELKTLASKAAEFSKL